MANDWFFYTIDLPLPTSVNRIRRRSGGGDYPNPAATAWKETAMAAMVAKDWRKREVEIPLRVVVVIRCSARRDLDNSLKILFDTISAVIGIDDRWIVEAHQYKRVVHKRAEYGIHVAVGPASGLWGP